MEYRKSTDSNRDLLHIWILRMQKMVNPTSEQSGTAE